MSKKISVLINAIGIRDSGGISTLNKTLGELVNCKNDRYAIICNLCENTLNIKRRYEENKNIDFIFIESNSFLYRLYYENFKFLGIINQRKVVLVYNFSGSVQFLHKTPQLTKVQNLLFFSKRLDSIYLKKQKFFTWVKQVFLKRLALKLMIGHSKYIEIQSHHVKDGLADFIGINDKDFYIKSDIEVHKRSFKRPKEYDFSKKIKFLYIVGPHFEYMHKNFIDFTNAMLGLDSKGVNFEINITLTRNQLNSSNLWSKSLNERTNFLGYISNQQKIIELFCDNTILISTSIIESLGLHVIEGIKNGIVTIAPNENYANIVYGQDRIKYELFDSNSLISAITNVINYENSHYERILSLQYELRRSEMGKYRSILDIFDEVVNV